MYNGLIKTIKEYDKVLLGFSGGVDSSLLAYALRQSGIDFLAVTVQTPFNTKKELAQSTFFCKEYNIPHHIISVDVLKEENIKNNSRNRCYYCKRAIFSAIRDFGIKKGYSTLFDGSNLDDLKVIRPGLKAADEMEVISPFVDCSFTKKDIRRISKEIGLPTYNMESNSCLATRIPYDTAIEPQILQAIEKGEEFLKDLGLLNVRLRVHKNVARIECSDVKLAVDVIGEKEINQIKNLGFDFVTVDLSGYKTGCYDKE